MSAAAFSTACFSGVQAKTSVRVTRRVACKAAKDLPKPEWLPEQGGAVLDFLNAQDFDIKEWGPYKKYVEKYVNDPAYARCYGWKELPEVINGRAAMLGFVAAASAEILGAGPVLNQLAAGPQVILSLLVLLTAASIVPIIKGVKGDYLSSLRETYTIPEDIFTEDIERVHARLAMAAMLVLLFVEMCKGSALL